MKLKLTWLMTLFMALVMQFSYAQEKTVTGTVISEADGLPLPGVNVIVKGTTRGVQTDFDGYYTISASAGETLVFSFVSMKTVEMKVGTSNSINVSMQEDVSALDEVVVVAYGTEKKQNITSAISTVDSESIEQIPNASLDQVLQGKAAGMNIQTSSGQPGASASVTIRGRSALAGVSEPLYVIDGVPVDEDNFRSLNSNDIANVSILKDASASALYGSRAAGGVIVVTTKKGTKNSGMKVKYRTLYGQSFNNDPGFDVMTSAQYLAFQKSMGIGLGAQLSEAESAALARQTNTDWADVFFRKGKTLSHEINVSTGNDATTTYTSIGYFEQEGTTQRSDLQRFNFRSNITSELNDRFTVNSNLTANFSKSNLPQQPGTGQLDNPFIVPYIAQPYVSPYNPDGSLNIWGTDYTTGGGTNGFLNTPFIALNTNALNSELEEEVRVIGNVGAKLKLVENLTVGSDLGLDYIDETYKNLTVPNSIRGEITPDAASENKGSQFEGSQRDLKINFATTVNYSKIFNDVHSLDITAGTEYWKRHYRYFGYTAYGLDPKLVGSGSAFTDGAVTEGEDGTSYYIPAVGSSSFDDGIFSYFAVGKYNYKDKYNFQASIRRDATQRFSDTNKWGTFWSVSGSWNIESEGFMDNVGFVNSLKLRASYGTTGDSGINSGLIGRFQSESLAVRGTGYNNTSGYFIGQLANPDLKWQTTKQANIGLDFALFDYKLSGTIDVYDKITDDVLHNQPLSSAASGFSSINANIGKISNKGVELSLNYRVVDNQNWRWSLFANAAYNKNEILELGDFYDGTPVLNGGGTALAEGHPITEFYRVRWAGVNPANGKPLYYDVNGNLTDTYSTADRVLTGKNQDPTYTGGFGTDLSYKNFSLNALFSFAADQYRLNGSYELIEDSSLANFANMSTALLRGWQQPGDITDIPVNDGTSYRGTNGDRYLEDASFLRLRTLSISYNVGKDVLERTKVFTGIRIYAQGQNLVTWSKWRGFDPESNLANTFFEYPTPRIFSLGFDIDF